VLLGYTWMIEDFEMVTCNPQMTNGRWSWLYLFTKFDVADWGRGTFYFSLFTFYLCGISWGDLGLQDVRVARADVDGDGIMEVVAGGRIGRALAADVPRVARQAGVGVYRVTGELLHPICERRDLFVVADVAGGDVDGDGVDEIVVVGMGHLIVFDVTDGQLVEMAQMTLPGDWTDRVMVGDVDGDGRVEIGVTVYRIENGAEMGRSDVIFLQWANRRLEKRFEIGLEGHVGDLCALTTADGQHFVALEVGLGDEGGDLRVLSGPSGRVFWRGEMTKGRVRALSLDAQSTNLVIGGVDGRVWTATLSTNGLSNPNAVHRFLGISGLVLMPDQLLLFSNRIGLQMLRF